MGGLRKVWILKARAGLCLGLLTLGTLSLINCERKAEPAAAEWDAIVAPVFAQARLEIPATGAFRSDFKSRSSAFIDVVKSAQSKSTGTVTEAAVESVDGKSGQVLVAVSVSTATRGVAEAAPRYWRMRLTVTKDDGGAKVSKVEFVR